MLEKLNVQKKNIRDIKDALAFADTDGDNMVNFDEWREELRKRGILQFLFNNFKKNFPGLEH